MNMSGLGKIGMVWNDLKWTRNGPGQELDNRHDRNMDAEMGTVEEGDRRN